LPAARAETWQLRFSLDPDADLVLADRVQIQQVLVNLSATPLKRWRSRPRRELVVTTARISDDMIEVEVSDTGSGFQDDVITKPVPDLLHHQRNRHGAWDCPSAAQIIEAHGGRMVAESNASGGATFRFTLPAADET